MPWPSMDDIAQFWGERPDTTGQWDPGTSFTAQKDPASTYGGDKLQNVPQTVSPYAPSYVQPEIQDSPNYNPQTNINLPIIGTIPIAFIVLIGGILLLSRR